MTLAAVKKNNLFSLGGIRHTEDANEVFAFCPQCKAFQTVWLNGNILLPTRKFRQEDGQIFHDCGSDRPCRVYV